MIYIFRELKTGFNFVLALSLPFSVILIFSAYGPAIHYICGPEQNNLFSSIFLFCLLSSMLIPVNKLNNKSLFKKMFYFAIAISAVLLAFFTVMPFSLKIAVLILLGFIEGRIAVRWSLNFLKLHDGRKKFIILTASLFLSYLLLYLANVTFPDISTGLIPVICSFLLVASIPFLVSIYRYKDSKKIKMSHTSWPVTIDISKRSRNSLLLMIFIIYLTAGFTYTKIFPGFREFGIIDRYYNVLTYVLLIPAAGVIALKAGLKHLPGIGIALLGISYIFHLLPPDTSTYFLVQSFIQPGWAFLNLFVWAIGAYTAQKTDNSRYLPVFISTFLAGTVTGAVLSSLVFKSDIIIALSVLPLFIVVPLLGRSLFTRTEKNTAATYNIPQNLLTEREHEIAELIFLGRSQKEICSDIHISINTLKTHRRNIYRKLGVKNKSELRRSI